ncbi:arginine--tRNA ligase [Sporosalibacterium faouarense]|uniref:arginine--tRNA ligase n=1 Tax=Sporosalibacterium faouarense TaxID=516123 RepID=UPI00141D3057|nr:arginine--tRNA ligase [Sporosalibacterium faouarense]MTI49502.1 arginine--tRNA ligase [Bacillota bacterium]
MINFKSEIAKLVSSQVENLSQKEVEELIEIPPNFDMGDYAMPCFKLAKAFRKSPNIIAEELAGIMKENKFFEKIENAGPYVNFFINKEKLVESVLKEVFAKKEKFGSTNIGEDKNVIVEFSSPNIAKPFHIGHIRTTVIGHALYNIYKFLGFNAIAVNHLGDYGTQFGKLIVAYKEWGDRETIECNPIPELLKLYIKFHEEAEKNQDLDDQARNWFTKLENENEEAVELWKWIREVSLKEFNRVYNMLNIKFDSFAGESFYSDKMPRVLDMMEKKGILTKSQGAEIVDLEPYDMPPALIKKSDGSTLYITRDIAAAVYRKETYNFYKNIYVVGAQQNLHFQQWFKIIELLDYEWAQDCIHVPFGMVSLEEGTMSTRKGRVVFLEDVLNKAVEQTKKIIEERNPNLENKEKVAEQVGVGAVVFQELYHNRIKDYEFSWERTLSFQGETGPYVQYTHARANSVLDKAELNITDDIDYSLLVNDESVEVVRLLESLPDVVINAMEKNEPSYITRHITDIAQAFNKFYHDCPILVDDEELKKARLLLVYSVKNVIKTGLGLLGMEAPEKM